MKKMFALMLAAMMLLAMMPAYAEPYTEVNFANVTPVKHTLSLTDADMDILPYNITYKFTRVSTVVDEITGGFRNDYLTGVGLPDISPIEYKAGDKASNDMIVKDLVIDWSKVHITEPGVYRWQFTKTAHSDDPVASNIGNIANNVYLVATVTIDNSGDLTAVIRMTYMQGEKENKVDNLADAYPAKVLSLTLAKEVEGNQGSKNQYFEFEVTLNSPAGAKEMEYTIDLKDATAKLTSPTAYNGMFTNESTVTVPAGPSKKTFSVWLKDDESIVIKDLLFNTTYSITEVVPQGYTTTPTVNDLTAKVSAATVSDDQLTQSATVTYTNNKNAAVPTGIELETAAPIVGMILAMAMLALLFVGKRKEEIA